MPRETQESIDRRGLKIMKRIHQQNTRAHLRARYQNTCEENCHCCGTFLEACGEPLSNYFIMDTHGCFYCMQCESIFRDGDKRIYTED